MSEEQLEQTHALTHLCTHTHTFVACTHLCVLNLRGGGKKLSLKVLSLALCKRKFHLEVRHLSPRVHDRQLATAMPGGVTRAGLAGGLGLLSSLLGIGGGTITTMTMTLCGTTSASRKEGQP